jgi:thiol-disulfide isomerase/thioredoxin
MFRRHSIQRTLLVALVLSAIFALADSDYGQPAPRFSAKTMTGERFTNESTRGQVVLLQFWATWCKYCRGEQALVDQLDHEFASKGLVTLAIDVGEEKKTVKKYLEENPRSCRIVLMGDTNLAARFASTTFPLYVLIDRDGNVVGKQHGAGGERALRQLLSKAGL